MTWNELLTPDIMMFMTKVTKLEETKNVHLLYEQLQRKTQVHKIEELIPKWNSMTENDQMTIGVEYVGLYHLSRFLLMMDYLAEKKMKKVKDDE